MNKSNALDQFHRKEPVLPVGHHFIERNQIRVRNVGKRAKLSFEAIDVGGFSAVQCLKRDGLVHLEIMRFVNDAHAARAQSPAQNKSVSPNKLFGGLSHTGKPRLPDSRS